MYKCIKWNKEDSFNGFDKDYWLTHNPIFNIGEVFLYGKETDVLQHIEIIAIESELRSTYNDYTTPIDQLAEVRRLELNEQLPIELKDTISKVSEQQEKISILEAENAQMQYAMMMGGLL